MPEIWRGEVRLIETDQGYQRKKTHVVDLGTFLNCNPGVSFSLGVNAVELVPGVMFGREVNENDAEFRVLTDYNYSPPRKLFEGWFKKKHRPSDKRPKHTGGRPSYLKLLSGGLLKFRDMADEAAGAVFKLLPFVNWRDGLLVHPKSKKPLDVDGLQKQTGYNKRTLYRRIEELEQAGVLVKTDSGFVLSREFIAKG